MNEEFQKLVEQSKQTQENHRIMFNTMHEDILEIRDVLSRCEVLIQQLKE